VSERPFPPSSRRIGLARHAGLTAASPVLVSGLVLATGAIAIAAARGLASHLADALAAACDGRGSLAPNDLALAVLAIAAPVLGAAALVAVAGQLAQTRAVWIPRRRIDGAPAIDRGAGARTRSVTLELAYALAVGAVGLGWLWLMAPRVAALVELDPAAMLPAAAALLGSALAALAIAWLALGVIDAIARHVELARALAMTGAEKREDERLAAADPRWARERAALARPSLEGASVLILGDDAAVAIAWDPRRRPVPTRVAIGKRAYTAQLLGLARRHGVPVHRDHMLAAALADAEGPVPAAQWSALAAVIAALRR
jgi:flagellar biosynthesis protein FlhB